MPADEYASVGGGLRLKGAKVSKPKKKKSKPKTDLEKNLSTGDEGPSSTALEKRRESPAASEDKAADASGDEAAPRKTEAERRFEERRRKKVCCPGLLAQPGSLLLTMHHSSWNHPPRGPSCSRRTRSGSRSSIRICPS